MVIFKVLNNNVAVVKNDKDVEQIVMGKGIAFQKKKGDEIDESKIDKKFTLSSSQANSNFQELVADIPLQQINLAFQIIDHAKTDLGKKLNDMIYISLTDHIYTAITRFQDGIRVKNALLYDIRRFYPDEFRIGQQALNMIEETTNVRLPDDEAGFIALHIANAEMDNENMQNMYEITKVMQEILNLVKYFFKVDFNEDSVYYYRFITHLKFFAQRLISQQTYDDDAENDLLLVIQQKYKNSYRCTLKVGEFLKEKYKYDISDEEKLYLTIHIERLVYKAKKEG